MYQIFSNDLHELLARRRAPLTVGHLPFEVRKHFGRSKEPVYLSRESYQHILFRHSDHVSTKELLLIPKVIREGTWILDRQHSCVVFLEFEDEEKILKAAVKVTLDRQFSYLTTFHRTSRRHFRQALKRKSVLRDSWQS